MCVGTDISRVRIDGGHSGTWSVVTSVLGIVSVVRVSRVAYNLSIRVRETI